MATGRQLKRKLGKVKQQERAVKTVQLLDALTKKVLELEERINDHEELLEAVQNERKSKTRLEVPVSAIGLKNDVKDFPRPIDTDDVADPLPEGEVLTYLPEDEVLK